jgi:hypothetical protein
MPTCNICQENSSQGEERVIYTARIVSQTEKVLYTSGDTRFVETTTRFSDFAEHHYFLCAGCKLRNKIALPAGVVVVLMVTIALFIASTMLHIAWLFAAALIALIAGMGPVSHLGAEAKLNKKALAERGTSAKGIHAFYFTGETGEFKAFDASEYARLRATS